MTVLEKQLQEKSAAYSQTVTKTGQLEQDLLVTYTHAISHIKQTAIFNITSILFSVPVLN